MRPVALPEKGPASVQDACPLLQAGVFHNCPKTSFLRIITARFRSRRPHECRHIPLEAFRCPGVLADVRHTDEAGLADVDLDAIPARAFVLFRTGRIERHAYGEPAYSMTIPS